MNNSYTPKARDAPASTQTNGVYEKTELHLAAENNDLARAKQLIENGADVNAEYNRGKTPLHRAAWKDSLAVAKWLMDNGADVHWREQEGETPLDWARRAGHTDMIQLLEKITG